MKPVFALCLARTLEAISASILLLLLPITLSECSASGILGSVDRVNAMALVMATFGLAIASIQPWAGKLIDRGTSPRRLALIGLFGVSITSLRLGFSSTLGEVLVLRAIQGLAIGLVIPSTLCMVGSLAPSRSRARTFGILSATKSFGFAVGPLLGGALLMGMSAQHAYWLTAGLPFLAGLALLPAQVETAPPPRVRPRKVKQNERNGKDIWILAAVAFCASGCATTLVVLQSPMSEHLNATSVGIGAALTAMLITRVLLEIPMGVLADRLRRSHLILFGTTTLALGTLLQAFVVNEAQLMTTRVVMGIGMALLISPTYALLTEQTDSARGYRLSIFSSGLALGPAAGALVTGLWAKVGLTAPFVFWFVLGAVNVVLLMKILKTLEQAEPFNDCAILTSHH